MTFEEFDKFLIENDWGIVGMNHYVLGGKRYLFCAITGPSIFDDFGFEDTSSGKVFDELCARLKDWNKQQL
ncbi:MAG: hypothetical protein GY861_21525 [bacterium]|nr:hypothetical protein [bacterium]